MRDASQRAVIAQTTTCLKQLTQTASAEALIKKSENVSLAGSLSADETDTIWQFYDSVHAQLSTVDPTNAGFSRSDFEQIVGSSQFTKVLYRTGQLIINICFVADVRNCPTLTRYIVKSNYPSTYRAGRIFCCIGLLSNPDVKAQMAPSIYTLGLVSKIVKVTAPEAVFSFLCNETSNRYIPKIAAMAIKSAGLKVNFDQPVSQEQFQGPAAWSGVRYLIGNSVFFQIKNRIERTFKKP